MLNVVILSPSRYSAYTIAVAEELLRSGVIVEAIVVKRLFNIKRVMSELKSGPRRFLAKIFRKLLFKRIQSETLLRGAEDYDPVYAQATAVEGISNVNDVPIFYCKSFHSNETLDYLASLKCDVISFTGGGILRSQVLDKPKIGVVNCHMGVLPAYRGMDCFAWAVLRDDYKNIGLTTHFMDPGIDTGDIIKVQKVDIRFLDSLSLAEQFLEILMPKMMVEAVLGLKDQTNVSREEQVGHGSQYFVMHRALRRLAEKKFLESRS